MQSSSLHELAISQLERLSRRGFQRLALPEPLESNFERSTAPQRSMRLWIEGLIAIGLFNIYVIIDHIVQGGTSWFSLQVRLCLITPIALLINASMRMAPNKIYRESSVAVVSCAIGLTHLWLESNKSAAASAYAQVGIIVTVIFVNVVMRLYFSYASIASLVLLAGDLVFVHSDHLLNTSDKLLGLTLVLSAVVMTLVANHSIGRDERMAYLMRLRGEIQSTELSSLNVELRRISSIDFLTGLANRHAYEVKFAELWREAADAESCISAIVIDIDHFKRVNDTSGHLYGDRVLVRVASLLTQSLRGKDDFAARFGGEEFVVLLPKTTQEGALIVAERIRKLVEVAGSPAQQRTDIAPRLSTVSCGVATCWPSELICPDDLLGAADRALYQAKAQGRNRVCWSELSTSTKKRPTPERRRFRTVSRSEATPLAKAD